MLEMHPTIKMRPLGSTDARLYRKLYLQALHDSPEALAETLEAAEDRPLEFFTALMSNVLAAFDCNDPVGIVTVELKPSPTLIASLSTMWISPQHRRQGVGTALLNAAIACAQQKGAKHVDLLVAIANVGAIEFYSRAGFCKGGQRNGMLRM
jgi:ribosomal protein S18 acetylase RimI-like enzyme